MRTPTGETMAEPMPMLLDDADRALLTERLLQVLGPPRTITDDEMRAAIREAANELVAESEFIFQDGVFIRWPPQIDGLEEQ